MFRNDEGCRSNNLTSTIAMPNKPREILTMKKIYFLHGTYICWLLREAAKKCNFFSVPATKALPTPLELSGHKFFFRIFFELQKKVLFLSGRTTKVRLRLKLPSYISTMAFWLKLPCSAVNLAGLRIQIHTEDLDSWSYPDPTRSCGYISE